MAKLEPMEKRVDYLLRQCSEHLANLRRIQRDNKINKMRADNLQKDKDANRAELSKNVGLKEKLEKLCRELQKDNNKLKVSRQTGRQAGSAQGNIKHQDKYTHTQRMWC